MNHSVSKIGQERQQLSQARMEAPYFSAKGFVTFANNNRDKYSVTETNGELFVNSWNVDALIADYKDALNVASGKMKGAMSSWICNECGSQEYTHNVSSEDIKKLQCSSCGNDEFHTTCEQLKKEKRKDQKVPTEDQVLQTIFNCVDIRGIDLCDYKRNFTNEQSGLYDALVKLFKN